MNAAPSGHSAASLAAKTRQVGAQAPGLFKGAAFRRHFANPAFSNARTTFCARVAGSLRPGIRCAYDNQSAQNRRGLMASRNRLLVGDQILQMQLDRFPGITDSGLDGFSVRDTAGQRGYNHGVPAIIL